MNNKGFMLAEVIIVSSIVVTMLVSMYVSLNKLLVHYNKLTTYYDIDTKYFTKNELDYLIDNFSINNYIYNIRTDNKSFVLINDLYNSASIVNSNRQYKLYLVSIENNNNSYDGMDSEIKEYVHFIIRNKKNEYKYLLVVEITKENGKKYYGYCGINNSTLINNSPTLLIKNTLVDIVKEQANKGTVEAGVYTVNHEAIVANKSATGSVIPESTDYRYYGTNPNNYVCLDYDDDKQHCKNNHLYRIIGVMNVDDGKEWSERVKIIKATPITDGVTDKFPWNSKKNSNIWASATNNVCSNATSIDSSDVGSTLMQMINSGSWWNNEDDFSNYGLSIKAKDLISSVRWYLGYFSSKKLDQSAPTSYITERQNYTPSNQNVTYALCWEGIVGLMYPSDFGYAAGYECVKNNTYLSGYGNSNGLSSNNKEHYGEGHTCYQRDWLTSREFEWLFALTTYTYRNNEYVAYLDENCDFNYYWSEGGHPPTHSKFVRPSMYLKSNVKYISGTGTEQDPYLIG